MFNSLVGNALSSVQRYDNIVCALAGYWYSADPAKQDRFPVVNPYPQGVLPDSTKTLADFESFNDWYSSFTFPLFGTQGQWKVTRFNDGQMIGEFSPDLQLVFADWYEYFNSEQSETQENEGLQTGDSKWQVYQISEPIEAGTKTFADGHTNNMNNYDAQRFTTNLSGYELVSPAGSGTIMNVRRGGKILYLSNNGAYYVWSSEYFDSYQQGYTTGYPITDNVQFHATQTTDSIKQSIGCEDGYVITGTIQGGPKYYIYTSFSNIVYDGNSLTGGGQTTLPDTPIYPPTPDEPEPDVPTSPTLPNLPDINFPDIGITTGNDNTTTTTDLQPILDALRIINDNLIATYDQMEGFDNWVFDAYSDLLNTMQNQTQYIGQWMDGLSKQIDSESKLILKELRKISYYLYQLLNKKTSGGGPIIDPVAQDDEVWNWWDAVLRKLLALLPTAVVEFLQQLQRLNSVFPFSIPWDIGFMLGLFTQPAQTPVFDIAINSAYFRWSAHVDLSQWNALATLIRRGELLAFAMTLAMYTPAALEQLKVI